MIRLSILLAFGLFLLLQIGGADRGQLRAGLAEAEAEVTLPPAARSLAAPQRVQALQDQSIEVAFTPAAPLITSPPPAAKLPLAEAKPAEVAVIEVSAGETDDPPALLTEDAPAKVMIVAGRSVNVRGGPSTRDAVVAKLTKGEAVTVVADSGTGWTQIRIEGDGVEGFISTQLLTEIE